MRSRKKEIIIIPNVTILDAGSEGKAIAKVDDMVVFVPFVVPGDVVDLQIFKRKKNYAEGKAIAIHQYSPDRAELKCPHFGICGGCKWQNMKYESQLRFKEKQVIDNLQRIGKVDTSLAQPICAANSIFFYRNKLEFTFSNKAWHVEKPSDETVFDNNALGFHVPGFFDKVLDIEFCALQKDPSNNIRLAVKKYAKENKLSYYDIKNHTGFLRNLIIRTASTGELMVILCVAEDDEKELMALLQFIYKGFPEITSLQWVLNTKFNDTINDLDIQVFKGKDSILEEMPAFSDSKPALKFKISPKSFYQTNSEQAFKLYSFAAEFAGLKDTDVVYDLYTGTGTIANFVAPYVKKVVGIEYVPEAIEDAKENALLNSSKNCTFFAGDMAKVFTDDFISKNGQPDIIITDPPRAGMDAKVVEQLLKIEATKIVYISCNPATQARDIQLLSEKYSVGRIQPVDMFPHTHHVENVVELILKN